MRILIVEDDDETAAFVEAGLALRGHSVERAREGREGLARGLARPYDVLILDRMIPGLDGVAIISRLREEGVATPALFLTFLSGIQDRVDGLAAGGDDYLVKPFAIDELAARVEALARRPQLGVSPTRLAVGVLEMDLVARKVRRGGREIELQPREFQLLEYLLRNAGKVVTRKMLLEHVWNYDFDPHTNIVETHMSRLRAKLDADGRSGPIRTLRGAGYSLRVEG